MSTLYFADASSDPFGNSPPETVEVFMLPTCLSNHTARGVFTSVSNRARMHGIEPGTSYTLVFSPSNQTYMFSVAGREYVTYGDYRWSLNETYRESAAGGAQVTRQSLLSLMPTARSMVGGSLYSLEDEKVSGMVIATDRNTASFSSALGIATFDIMPGGA